jgi:hypothetical protein
LGNQHTYGGGSGSHDTEFDVAVSELSNGVSSNGVSSNGVSSNGVSSNGVSSNGVSSNGVSKDRNGVSTSSRCRPLDPLWLPTLTPRPNQKQIDLNADCGEGFDDAGLLAHVTSVNIACGGHVGA